MPQTGSFTPAVLAAIGLRIGVEDEDGWLTIRAGPIEPSEPFTYCSGLARNFRAHPLLQK